MVGEETKYLIFSYSCENELRNESKRKMGEVNGTNFGRNFNIQEM